ncbi:ABC transporter substrate-binding protein [Candidatus Bathyarchaeota archaeon]|nr:MAG: ABC transporter substrate-binding protein [Candidatus Bathyarchaeota archaeon]
MEKFLLAIDNVSQKTGEIVSLLIFPIIAFVVYEVIMRYFFRSPTEWVFETSLFLFGAMMIIGGCYVLKERRHVNMDVLYSRLPLRTRALLDVITAPIFFAFSGVLLIESVKMMWESWAMRVHSESPWGPPLYPVVTTIPIGALLLLLQGVAKFIRDLRVVVSGRSK